MRLVTLLFAIPILSACATESERYVRHISEACSGGSRDACQALATAHPQALRDADAIVEGMRRAHVERRSLQGANP